MKYIITMKLYICKEHNNIVINFSETLTGYTHIRLLECKLNNSWYNITNENNEIVFSIDNKNSTKVIEPGNYNVETLSQAIGRTKLINFKRVLPTGKTQMVLDDKVKVNFSRPKNFARILGFKEIEYSKSGISPYKANFLPVTEYVVRCNLIDTPTNYIINTAQSLNANISMPISIFLCLYFYVSKEVDDRVTGQHLLPVNMRSPHRWRLPKPIFGNQVVILIL